MSFYKNLVKMVVLTNFSLFPTSPIMHWPLHLFTIGNEESSQADIENCMFLFAAFYCILYRVFQNSTQLSTCVVQL